MSSVRALLLKKLSSAPKKYFRPYVFIQLPQFLGDAPAAFHAMLPLVVSGDRAIGAGEFAAKGQHDRADRAELADAARRATACEPSVARPLGGFQQAIAEDRIGQFIQIAEQALDAGVDQFFGQRHRRSPAQKTSPGIPSSAPLSRARVESGSHRLARPRECEQHFEQAEQDKFFAGDDDIRRYRDHRGCR